MNAAPEAGATPTELRLRSCERMVADCRSPAKAPTPHQMVRYCNGGADSRRGDVSGAVAPVAPCRRGWPGAEVASTSTCGATRALAEAVRDIAVRCSARPIRPRRRAPKTASSTEPARRGVGSPPQGGRRLRRRRRRPGDGVPKSSASDCTGDRSALRLDREGQPARRPAGRGADHHGRSGRRVPDARRGRHADARRRQRPAGRRTRRRRRSRARSSADAPASSSDGRERFLLDCVWRARSDCTRRRSRLAAGP